MCVSLTACVAVCCSTKDLEKYGDYFLGYDNATKNVTQVSNTFCAQMNIKPPYTPDNEHCQAYYWNLCNDDAVDYYVDTVLTNMVSKGGKRRNMDGLFIDWAGNFVDTGGRNGQNCPGQNMKVHLKTFQMLQKYDMWPVFSLADTTAEAELLWKAGVGYTQFTGASREYHSGWGCTSTRAYACAL